MSLEQNIQELNKNIVKLISIFEVYPNPIDEVVIDKKKVAERVAEQEQSPITDNVEVDTEFKPAHTIDEVAELAKKAIQANKTENRPKLKDKMDALGIAKVSATPPKHIDTMYEFLESLV